VFKNKLRHLLLQKSVDEGRRITQQELAQETGIREATISNWMNNERLAKVEGKTVSALLKYFNLTNDQMHQLIEPIEDPELLALTTAATLHA
jgi:transcriptional regulator with XRE-family HTH domain